MKRSTLSITALLILTVLLPGQDSGEEQSFSSRYFENAKVIRVKYVEGEAFVDRSYDEGLEEATINLPVFEKDSLQTTDGRMEIYLGRLNYMRLDYDTDINLEKIPILRHTSLAANLNHGAIYLDINNLDYEKDIEIQTPDCGIFILGSGIFRINVTQERGTEIWVQEGLLEVAGTGYSRDVRNGQKVVFTDGHVTERPFYFRTAMTDDFDQWHKSRDHLLGTARYGTSRYMDEGYSDYEYELSRNGRWVFSHTYNSNIWIPHRLMDGWRPYYNGRWVWHPHYGYVWNSYDSWGWFTHHYGRWHWDTNYGWHWLAGYRWSPAWVSWFWNDSYYGWAPLSYWNRPVIVLNRRWNRHYRYWKGIPSNSLSTVVIRKDRLLASDLHKHALNTRGGRDNVIKHTIPFRGNAPTLHPKVKTVHVVNAKGRNVIFKRGGLTSVTRYRTNDQGVMIRKTTTSKTRIANRYSTGKIQKRVSGKFESRSVQKRVIHNGNSSSRYSTTKDTDDSKDKKANSSSSSSSSTRVRKKTVSKRTVPKRTTTSKKSGTVKKAKRKKSSPSAVWTAHYSAPSAVTGATRFHSTSSNDYRPVQKPTPKPESSAKPSPERYYRYGSAITPYKKTITTRYTPRPSGSYSSYGYPRYSSLLSGARTSPGTVKGRTYKFTPSGKSPTYSKPTTSSSYNLSGSGRISHNTSSFNRGISRSFHSSSPVSSNRSARRRK